MLKIHKDFSGASIGEYSVFGQRIVAKLREEQITCMNGLYYDYNWHFAFGIENTENKTLPVEIFINCEEKESLPFQKALLFHATSPKDEFKRFECESRTNLEKSYYVKFELGANQTIYLANYYFRQYERLIGLFDQMGELGQAIREVIGHSIEGRELVCYRYSESNLDVQKGNSRPVILITSGFHPPEGDTLATEAIMEYLASGEGGRVKETFDFYVVPILNPDGFVHGYNGCNASQINFYWKFDEQDQIRCPEAYYLWKLVERIHPIVYFDFHGYTFQLFGKYASPYIKPVVFYEGKEVRDLVRTLNKDMISLTDGKAEKGILTFVPSTLSSKLTKKYNTITYAKYHLCLKDGIQRSKQLAVDSLKMVVNRLSSDGFVDSSRILKSPYGLIRRNYLMEILRALIILWGRQIQPALSRVKKWTFH
jgi:hypothetical protein